MTGSRFVHDTIERCGWDVMIADAVKAKGVAPLAAKTDKIDAHVLAELARRDLVPEIWLPDPGVRADRERARFRLHLVHHRSALKCRIHATLMTFGHAVPVTDLFGTSGRELLAGFEVPEPWATTLATSLAMVDELDERKLAREAEEIQEVVRRDLGFDHQLGVPYPNHPNGITDANPPASGFGAFDTDDRPIDFLLVLVLAPPALLGGQSSAYAPEKGDLSRVEFHKSRRGFNDRLGPDHDSEGQKSLSANVAARSGWSKKYSSIRGLILWAHTCLSRDGVIGSIIKKVWPIV